jgi:TolB-like protein/Tfp pilus assembly protein PilF
MEQYEEDCVRQWLGLVERVRSDVLPGGEGRYVKSLGDGMLLEFDNARAAVQAAFRIQELSRQAAETVAPDRQIWLRMGIECGQVLVGSDDVFGHDVNLAARLMTLAGPGEIVVSARSREQLTPDLDAVVEDLGECYVKHVKEPIRAYRVGPPGPTSVMRPVFSVDNLEPSIAIIPFSPRTFAGDDGMLGDVIAEELIRGVTRFSELSAISRLSTRAFGGRDITMEQVATHLKADYVLAGSYQGDPSKLFLDMELAEVESGRVIWSYRAEEAVQEILSVDQGFVHEVVAKIAGAIATRELQRSMSQSLPTLKAYSLLLAAVTLMHRLSRHDFNQSYALLQTLTDRAPRQAVPLAWSANWHVLKVQQGWSADQKQDAYCALDCTKRALDADPNCSLALAVDGFVHTNLLKQLDVAEERYNLAIDNDTNNSLAWLLRGTLHAFMGHGEQAVTDTQRALKLAPLDPHRYFYESLAATACLAAHDYEGALDLSRRSLRANRTHTSTLRVLAAAQWALGQHEEARESAKELLQLEPGLTVSSWLARSPSAHYSTGKEWARLLQEVGVPK